MTAQFKDAQSALSFILGGNSTFTIRSERTGKRFTFRVKEANTPDLYFVSLLTGSSNEDDYNYVGLIGTDGIFKLTKKSRMRADSEPVVAFDWAFRYLTSKRRIPALLSVWPSGRCGRCNRLLTDPESVRLNFGPGCRAFREAMGLARHDTRKEEESRGLPEEETQREPSALFMETR